MFKPVRPNDPFGLVVSPEMQEIGKAATCDPSEDAAVEGLLSAVVAVSERPYTARSPLGLEDGVLVTLSHVAAEHPEGLFDAIFADPPFFTAEGDRLANPTGMHEFDLEWLSCCQKLLKPNGAIWVSGTLDFVHSAGFAMQQLGFKLLNDVVWDRGAWTSPRNRMKFASVSQTYIWAAKTEKSKHYFDYKLMKQINGGKQMKSFWTIPAPQVVDPTGGPYPAAKPVDLVSRMLLASTKPGDLILDLSPASNERAVIALELGRRYTDIGMEGL